MPSYWLNKLNTLFEKTLQAELAARFDGGLANASDLPSIGSVEAGEFTVTRETVAAILDLDVTAAMSLLSSTYRYSKAETSARSQLGYVDINIFCSKLEFTLVKFLYLGLSSHQRRVFSFKLLVEHAHSALQKVSAEYFDYIPLPLWLYFVLPPQVASSAWLTPDFPPLSYAGAGAGTAVGADATADFEAGATAEAGAAADFEAGATAEAGSEVVTVLRPADFADPATLTLTALRIYLSSIVQNGLTEFQLAQTVVRYLRKTNIPARLLHFEADTVQASRYGVEFFQGQSWYLLPIASADNLLAAINNRAFGYNRNWLYVYTYIPGSAELYKIFTPADEKTDFVLMHRANNAYLNLTAAYAPTVSLSFTVAAAGQVEIIAPSEGIAKKLGEFMVEPGRVYFLPLGLGEVALALNPSECSQPVSGSQAQGSVPTAFSEANVLNWLDLQVIDTTKVGDEILHLKPAIGYRDFPPATRATLAKNAAAQNAAANTRTAAPETVEIKKKSTANHEKTKATATPDTASPNRVYPIDSETTATLPQCCIPPQLLSPKFYRDLLSYREQQAVLSSTNLQLLLERPLAKQRSVYELLQKTGRNGEAILNFLAEAANAVQLSNYIHLLQQLTESNLVALNPALLKAWPDLPDDYLLPELFYRYTFNLQLLSEPLTDWPRRMRTVLTANQAPIQPILRADQATFHAKVLFWQNHPYSLPMFGRFFSEYGQRSRALLLGLAIARTLGLPAKLNKWVDSLDIFDFASERFLAMAYSPEFCPVAEPTPAFFSIAENDLLADEARHKDLQNLSDVQKELQRRRSEAGADPTSTSILGDENKLFVPRLLSPDRKKLITEAVHLSLSSEVVELKYGIDWQLFFQPPAPGSPILRLKIAPPVSAYVSPGTYLFVICGTRHATAKHIYTVGAGDELFLTLSAND
ncbi:hypothetical protein B7R76_06125 [Mageeibacillus indolicus]|uniref:Uncharacterized protein n=1 Tax=Mageeibacillus indolicus TaxID=884684 RepID=A0A2J8B0X5_9FIRM|nr:hypothetical protein [Mageeibacillus indolicus]PNH18414.1 hypothetical protein B7R76_06125 [Mageeibacillus indolicus]